MLIILHFTVIKSFTSHELRTGCAIEMFKVVFAVLIPKYSVHVVVVGAVVVNAISYVFNCNAVFIFS